MPVPISKRAWITTQSTGSQNHSRWKAAQRPLGPSSAERRRLSNKTDQATRGFVQSGIENQDGDKTTPLGNMLNCLSVLVGKKPLP